MKLSKKLLEYRDSHPVCEACGDPVPRTCSPHHIRTRGSGGGDEPENLLRLCPDHHYNVVHGLPGIKTLCRLYPHILSKVVKQKPKLKSLLEDIEFLARYRKGIDIG